MYCQTCGNKLVQAITYCNHCGAQLRTVNNPQEIQATSTAIDTIMWVIVGMAVTLLGMALGAMVLIKDGTIDADLGRVFVILSLVAFVVVESVLVWRLLHLHKLTKEQQGSHPAKDSDQPQLVEGQTRALKDPGEPVATVTEQTTRNLEPSFRKASGDKT